MEKNNKIFISILILSVISWFIGSSLLFYLRLDEPVFFSHYYDLRFENNNVDTSFTLRYITNYYDNKKVVGVSFPEYPEVQVYATENNSSSWVYEMDSNYFFGEIFGPYSVRNIYCTLPYTMKEVKLDNPITKARIHFDKGQEIVVDLGEIYFFENNYINNFFEETSGFSHGGEEIGGEYNYKVLDDIYNVGIESRMSKDIQDFVSIKLNDIPLEDKGNIFLKAGEELNIEYVFHSGKNSFDDYNKVDMWLNIAFTDKYGNDYSYKIINIRGYSEYYNYYKVFEIYNYIKERGGE